MKNVKGISGGGTRLHETKNLCNCVGSVPAIDFEMYIDKIEDPKGDRVKVTMSGKFLGYKNW